MDLYKDMTARDLLQQRHTTGSGDTVWRESPLVTAAREGHLLILDGLHRMDPGSLTVLQQLIQDRDCTLHDGTRLLAGPRYEALQQSLGLSEADMQAAGIFPVHSAFRLVALAEPIAPGSRRPWLSDELLAMFHYHVLQQPTPAELRTIIRGVVPGLAPESLEQLLQVTTLLQSASHAMLTDSVNLSVRRLLHLARWKEAFPGEPLAEALRRWVGVP